jgi:tetratricopeptide (TPR) repeat protein
MPNDPPDASAAPPAAAAAGLSAGDRARLAQCFQTGTQSVVKNIDYAIEMFRACVVGDPSNPVYLQSFLGTLRRKHGPKKTGGLSALFGAPGRGGLKKLVAAEKCREAIQQGLDVLSTNPYDHSALLVMAEAAGKMGFIETQRVYLKAALDAVPADAEVNRHCARFLASRGEYDQAVACWLRISKVKGFEEEAQRAIADLQVTKTIVAGQGLPGRAQPGAAQPGGAPAGEPAAGSRRASLEQAIARNPLDIESYLELADVLEREDTVANAEKLLAKALAASGNDIKVQEHIEDRQLLWVRHKVLLAEKRLAESETTENRDTVARLRAEQLKHEIDIYSARATRYPENVNWKHELAIRLKSSGNYPEAIKQFQQVLQDARRKGAVALELGECFQKIRQYQLAMRNYQTAVDSLTDRDQDLRKRALYRAGVLAAGLDDPDSARKYLSLLAEMDFGYRDVAERLDKLTPRKDKG